LLLSVSIPGEWILYVSEKMHTGFGDECMSLIKMDKSIKRRKK
jgi:hypothetical protein